jgi:hypothetical protein
LIELPTAQSCYILSRIILIGVLGKDEEWDKGIIAKLDYPVLIIDK